MSKLLQGPEVRYQALEKAALAVVFSARRLRHYFQSFTVVVMTDLSEGAAEARRGRRNGALGGGPLGIRRSV